MLINHRAVAGIGRVDGDAGMCLAQHPRRVLLALLVEHLFLCPLALTHLPVFALFEPNTGSGISAVCQLCAAHTGAFGALMHGWGQSFDWAALAFAWLVACAIGLAIYFLPVARLLDSLTE